MPSATPGPSCPPMSAIGSPRCSTRRNCCPCSPCGCSATRGPAARALDKHAHRDAGHWGVSRGGNDEKNEQALALVERVLDEATWWNVFGHFKHGIVYEARLPAGQGARWAVAGPRLIGFLEPF